jgi:hypothetical protein
VVGSEVQTTGFTGGQPESGNNVYGELGGGDEKVGEEGQNMGNYKSLSSEQMFATNVLASREMLSAVYRFRV